MKHRIEFFDKLKFFAIYLVVLGHFLFYIKCGLLGNLTYKIIYTFHMPLFIMISGYFSQNYRKSFLPFLRNKFQFLLLPVLTWTLIICLYSLFTDKLVERIVIEVKGNSWFLKVLFMSQIVMWVLKKIPLHDYILCSGSVLLFLILPMGCTFQFNFMFSFFWMGYFLGKYKSQIEPYSHKIMIIAGLVFVITFVMVTYQKWNFTNLVLTNGIWFYLPHLVIAKYIAGFSGSLFLSPYLKNFRKEATNKLLCQIGDDILWVFMLCRL